MSNTAVSFSPRKITKNGQIVLPKAIRDALGVANGDYVSFNLVGDQVVVTKEPINEAVKSGRQTVAEESFVPTSYGVELVPTA